MWALGPIGFTAPLLLLALIVLPVLWFVLRAVPPAPIRRRFPGVALLLGLADDESQSDKTPWWLLLLRIAAVAAAILGFAGPVLNPQTQDAGSGPLLVLIDGTWADARDWASRMERVEAIVTEAGRAGRPVALAAATDLPADGPEFQAADAWMPRIASLQPQPWAPDPKTVAAWAEALDGDFDTAWLSDGLVREGRGGLLSSLEARGSVRVYQSPRAVLGLRPATFEAGEIRLSAVRSAPGPETALSLVARGLDPGGTERDLARIDTTFPAGETEAEIALALPPELRNRISRFELGGIRSAGAVSLTDDTLRRREVALIAGRDDREGLELLSPLHYLRQALEPTADLIEGAALADIVQANPDVIVMADVARTAPAEEEALTGWLEEGGLLVRFAGPRLAGSDVSRDDLDPLMPVRLRIGGRSVGGAMSWGEPKGLQPFEEGSPFAGLDIPADVTVSAQVLAQPDPTLAERSIASLADGTPLVTTHEMGDGRIVLFHVTANAEWSSLPLSGLFVGMLERLAVSTRPAQPDAEDLAGTTWAATDVLDGFGQLAEAGTLRGIEGARLATGTPGPDMPPGLYAGDDRMLAVNVLRPADTLAPAVWPDRIAVEGLGVARETQLKGALLTLALLVLAADLWASLMLAGKLAPRRRGQLAGLALAALCLSGAPVEAPAQGAEAFALEATAEMKLAHVVTGDAQVDAVTLAGLAGLSQILFARTSIEPSEPIGVDLEMDELSFFPMLYWVVTPDQPLPSSDAYAKLNRYLRSGGMILFDTRDADTARYGGTSPAAARLQAIARPLDIPPLEPIPQDHVLTRTFYLLQDFPGRHDSAGLWVEASPPDAAAVEGMPFRNLNDGVTPVVIGGNDWAAAWAVDARGGQMFPVGRGYAGERQRELAYRFGVNLVMHVLTGNYKSDQVHVPALLDRLGQ